MKNGAINGEGRIEMVNPAMTEVLSAFRMAQSGVHLSAVHTRLAELVERCLNEGSTCSEDIPEGRDRTIHATASE